MNLRSIISWASALALSGLLSACGGGSTSPSTSAENATTNSTGNATVGSTFVRLIHLNDLHAHMTEHKEKVRYADGSIHIETRGGLPRIATRIQQLRTEQPQSLLMNIGDTYHGGVEALFTNGNAIVDPVDALGIDIGVPGNWDFAYGPQVTRARYNPDFSNADVKSPNFPNLAGNVTFTTPGRRGDPFLPATALYNIGGVNVGLIGITSDIVPRMSEILALGMSFLTARNDYLALINDHARALRAQGATIVVVMSELGIHKDLDLANSIEANAVDVFFSAHTHESTFTPEKTNSGAIVVEAGNDTFLGYMDFEVNNGVVLNKLWSLETIDSTIAPDPSMQALVDLARAPFLDPNVNMSLPSPIAGNTLTAPIDTVVGVTPISLDRRNALENTFNNVMTDSLRQVAGTDIAMTPGFRYDAVVAGEGQIEDNVVASGQVTLEDLYRFFPVPFTLSTAQVSVQRLKEIIENNLTAVFSPNAFSQSGGWFDGFSGLDLSVNLANPDGGKIVDIRLTGDPLPLLDTDILNVAGCSRPIDRDTATTLCSYSGFTGVTSLLHPVTNEAFSPVAFFQYAMENGFVPNTVRHSIVDENLTKMWPNDPFYQPLYGVQ